MCQGKVCKCANLKAAEERGGRMDVQNKKKLIKCVFVWQLHCMCWTGQSACGSQAQSTHARTRNTRDTVVVNQNISDTETITIQREGGSLKSAILHSTS